MVHVTASPSPKVRPTRRKMATTSRLLFLLTAAARVALVVSSEERTIKDFQSNSLPNTKSGNRTLWSTSALSPPSPSLPPSTSTSTTPLPSRACKQPCANGICDPSSGTCHCNPGWRGELCELCGGKIRLNTTKGWLADAVGNYTVDTKCTWLIEAPSPNDRIRIHLKEFATECGWDHLYVFDGDSVFSNLSAVFSGMVRHDRYSIVQVPEVVAKSGSFLIHFYSDVAYNMTGFNITFSINSCPSEHYDLTCSGHGTCLTNVGECKCDEDYKGPACNLPACPKNCEPDGVRRGSCNKPKKRCECVPGFTGEACSQPVENGYWLALNATGVLPPIPRTSHAAMADQSGKMWVIGGETFSHSKYMVSTFTPDLKNDDVQGVWRIVHAQGEKGPSPRYGHSAVIHDERIYMYGGTMRSGHTSKELWALDLNSLIWERVETTQGRCMASGLSGQPKLCGPINSMGHTANVITNRMIVIFGHSPKYGYLSTVQEYHFGNKEWSIVPAIGYPVRGGFGHTSVWDDITNLIYVYGGYVSIAATAASLSNDLYSYDPIIKKWTLHSRGLSPRYLHSAVASNGLMIVYGGNTHNDTSWSQGAKCFSSDVLVYDILCDTWHNLQNTIPQEINSDLPRFGHSAVLLNGTMLIHGGFHGVLKSDTVAYVPGSCESFGNRNDCLQSVIGIKCVWNSKKDMCEVHPPNRAKSGIETCLPKKHIETKSNYTEVCSSLETCASCTSTSFNCVWCGSAKCRWKNCVGDTRRGRQGRVSSQNEDISEGIEIDADLTMISTPGDNLLDEKSVFGGNLKPLPSSSPGHQSISRLEDCINIGDNPTAKDVCPMFHTCHACAVMSGCSWDIDKNSKCREARVKRPSSSSATTQSPTPTTENTKTLESSANSTELEQEPEGSPEFQGDGKHSEVYVATESDGTSPCSPPCSERTTCSNCTHGLCMWCKNLEMCIERNAYLATFPYGQCMDWTTQSSQCGGEESNDDMCASQKTCSGCRSNPACGWCDNGTGTGVGTCMIGGASGPLTKRNQLLGRVDWIPTDTCQSYLGKSWHFTSCPDCLCNGHSKCSLDSKVCDKPCNHHTEGAHCEKCSKGYYGSPVNGGECEQCQCNNQATDCNHQTGRCHCTTKGIIGDKCQSCDKVNHYYGDPITDSCFYELAIDYQFTFNLSKSDDKHLTGINFKNTPTKIDVDVDFSITCSVPAKMNLTIRYTPPGKEKKEQQFFLDQNCTMFKHRFSKEDFVFGVEENTTFFVYVYDFDAPLWIIISFSQHPKLDLLQFFITFSTCFLALLLIAAILWKIKQKYDRYRRRQRLFVEMEQMASRPFGTVLVEMDKPSDVYPGSSTSGSSSALGHKDESNLRRRRKKHRPSPIALEPCVGNRAAVLSLIVRLPTGGKPYTPNGYTGMAVASSLVTLGNPRKTSCDTPNRQSVEDPKSGRKGRKGNSTPTVDI